MEIIDVTGKPPLNKDPLVLVIGKFDGIHKGHQQILQTAKGFIDESSETLAVMGFSDHPLWILKQNADFEKRITPDNDKLALLKQYGVGRYYRIKFTKEYAKTTANTFVVEHLSQLNIKRIIIGEGFRFGSGGASSTGELVQLCAQLNIDVTVLPLIKENAQKISSSTIRAAIKEGLMEPVHSLLGRPFAIKGTVIHGEKMGRKLGFPTINIGETEAYVEPKPGVYLGVVGIYNESIITDYYHALISAGYRPSVNGEGYLVEAYLLNYSGDLYGKSVSVSFLRYLRGEINFSNLDDLVKQMELDKSEAEKLMGFI
ncbi:riboflavin biosynthesis protein RibF [Paraliobacillus zengyii]|uniref:riboflavin biosynthesis protein RibF n=1 Tax=Paraliobacillus zengyii TaxID=2213194 RepID=UPI000DD3963A|nr:riboflavin biosynthesis protein RibF [Paraliobacillus zengyii]